MDRRPNVRERLWTLIGGSERTFLLGAILLGSVFSIVTGYLLMQSFAIDVLSSLLSVPQDCWLDWGMRIGRHCFSDYPPVVEAAMQPNPWAAPAEGLPIFGDQPLGAGYPAAGMLPHLLFGLPAKMLGIPPVGLVAYLISLTLAVLTPALWAARGTSGLERLVVFVALGAAAVPAWAVIDRGNSVGFVVPIALVFLLALTKRRWGLVAIMVVVAALVKPQFAALAVVLLVVRQWRWAGYALVGVAITNLAAYLLWPRDFPGTIMESLQTMSFYGNWFPGLIDMRNVSFGRALLLIPDSVKAVQSGGSIPEGFLAGPRSLIGYAILAAVVISLLTLGRRIPPVMAGIVLLAAAALSPSLTMYYYLVFALPVAALIVRDPDGPPGTGIFDALKRDGRDRRAVGITICLAGALSIAQIALVGVGQVPIYGQLGAGGVIGTTVVASTTAGLATTMWLVVIVVVIASYARKPAIVEGDEVLAGADGPATVGSPALGEVHESSPPAPA